MIDDDEKSNPCHSLQRTGDGGNPVRAMGEEHLGVSN